MRERKGWIVDGGWLRERENCVDATHPSNATRCRIGTDVGCVIHEPPCGGSVGAWRRPQGDDGAAGTPCWPGSGTGAASWYSGADPAVSRLQPTFSALGARVFTGNPGWRRKCIIRMNYLPERPSWPSSTADTRHPRHVCIAACDGYQRRASLPYRSLDPQPLTLNQSVVRVRKPSMVSISSVTSNGLDAKRIGPPNGSGRRPIRS